MAKFRMSAEVTAAVNSAARDLTRMLRRQRIAVGREQVTAALTSMVRQIGERGEVNASVIAPQYNQAGDTLALAYQTFIGGDMKNALHMAALAFTADDCRPLMDAIVQTNDEARPEDKAVLDNSSEENTAVANAEENDDENEVGDIDTSDEEDEVVTSSERKFRRRLDKTIASVCDTVTAEFSGDDDDDENADDNNDDELSADDDADDEVGGDVGEAEDFSDAPGGDNSDSDYSADNDDDNEDENSDDDAEDDGEVMARLLRRVKKSQPEVIAAANKISLGGSKKSRDTAGQFLVKVGNIGRRR